MVKATPIGPEEKDSALRRRNGTIPFQVNRFFLMTSKTAAVEYRKPGTDFGPPGDVTDRERRSLYDQRSCHFGSALYQDAPDVKNYFGTQSEPFRADKRILADAVFAPAVTLNSSEAVRFCCHHGRQYVFFLTHYPVCPPPSPETSPDPRTARPVSAPKKKEGIIPGTPFILSFIFDLY
jgi:hypothetical protein